MFNKTGESQVFIHLQTLILVATTVCLVAVSEKAFGLEDNAEVFTEEQRLTGFAEHNRKNSVIDQERRSGSAIVTKKRQDWEKSLNNSVQDYKIWKSRQFHAVDESSPEYKEDRAQKKQKKAELEQWRKDYVAKRNLKAQQKKSHVHLTEEEELGLTDKQVRADYRKRALYGAKNPWLSGKNAFGGAGTNSSSDSGSAPPPPDFSAPPPPPSGPDFYEPDIPPPPPPEPGTFDEPVPPPIFDDPEF